MFWPPKANSPDDKHTRAIQLIDGEIADIRRQIGWTTDRERYAQKELIELGKKLAPLLLSRAILVGTS